MVTDGCSSQPQSEVGAQLGARFLGQWLALQKELTPDLPARATDALTAYLSQMGQPLYQCIPPTGYSDLGIDWLNPSSQIYRMNFALDLAQGLVNGVTVNVRNFALGADLTSPSSVAKSANAAVFGGTIGSGTIDAAARVDTRITNPSSAVRVSALLLAGPESQVR